MPNAVRPDDTLDLELKVLEKRESKSKLDRGILRLRIMLRNQRRETVLECIVTVLIARRPDKRRRGVRSGSNSEVAALWRDVSFTPESGHLTDIPGAPFRAKAGHMRSGKQL